MTIKETEHIINKCQDLNQFDSTLAFAKIEQQIKQNTKRRHLMFWSGSSIVAAVLVIGLMLWLPYERISNPSQTPLLVLLPDHSEVTLNQGAQIRYAKNMKRQRHLHLKGEAFFNITPNPKKPFTIQAGQHQVKVLGTSFNVKCENGCQALEVLVTSGLVEVSNALDQHIYLAKDDFARGSQGTLEQTTITNIDTNYLAWYQQKMVFNASPLSYVLQVIENTYHQSILLKDDKLKTLRISTTFDGLSLEEVLTSISLTLKLEVSEQGDNYILSQK